MNRPAKERGEASTAERHRLGSAAWIERFQIEAQALLDLNHQLPLDFRWTVSEIFIGAPEDDQPGEGLEAGYLLIVTGRTVAVRRGASAEAEADVRIEVDWGAAYAMALLHHGPEFNAIASSTKINKKNRLIGDLRNSPFSFLALHDKMVRYTAGA
jgi:hypothetical protein